MTEDTKDGLTGLPERIKIKRLTLASWFNGGAAMLFLALFIQQATRDCVSLEKFEQSKNETVEVLKEQLKRQAQQAASERVQTEMVPRVQEVKKSIDTLNRNIDSLNNKKI